MTLSWPFSAGIIRPVLMAAPNGGEILTADLSLATPSAWSGTLRAGARMLLNNSVQIEATGGYLSFGQSGLDIWEGKLHVSYGF